MLHRWSIDGCLMGVGMSLVLSLWLYVTCVGCMVPTYSSGICIYNNEHAMVLYHTPYGTIQPHELGISLFI